MILKRHGYELTEPCQCRECAGECTSLIPKKWYVCNPCAKGYHVAPCEAFVEDYPPHMIPECKRCGYEKGEHADA